MHVGLIKTLFRGSVLRRSFICKKRKIGRTRQNRAEKLTPRNNREFCCVVCEFKFELTSNILIANVPRSQERYRRSSMRVKENESLKLRFTGRRLIKGICEIDGRERGRVVSKERIDPCAAARPENALRSKTLTSKVARGKLIRVRVVARRRLAPAFKRPRILRKRRNLL